MLKIIAHTTPNCKTCGLPMDSLNFFANEHEHVKCSADRVTDRLMEIFRDNLKDFTNEQ